MATDTTSRTKKAVRIWAGLGETAPIVLDDPLDKLRTGALNSLLTQVNGEFDGEGRFPIKGSEWLALAPASVRMVRDECQKRRDA